MKIIRTMLFVIAVAVLCAYVTPTRASAMTAGELKNLKVLKHYFSTGIITSNREIWTNDPEKGRYLILTFSADSPTATWIFSSDFVLSYTRNGDEDRALCAAIGIAEKENAQSMFFHIGVLPSVRASQGKIYFALAFLVESGVDSVTVQRINGSSVTYRIGRERPYSVFIATNTGSRQLLSGVEDTIKSGGYEVVDVSDELNNGVSETIIHYNEQSEREAREISQRLMVKFGLVPALKKTNIASAFDIVVWLGERSQKIQL